MEPQKIGFESRSFEPNFLSTQYLQMTGCGTRLTTASLALGLG